MENYKGLCITCDFDTTCVFNRKFPVIFCEEFSVINTKVDYVPERNKCENAYDDETMENCFCGE